MYQSRGKYDRGEQLIQYAIEIFDLIEIVPPASTGKLTGHGFRQVDTLPITRHKKAQDLVTRVAVNS
jgi:hypothetical protein